DVLRLEFQNLRVPGRRVGDGAAPVHIEAVLQQSGCQRARHPAPRAINMRAIATPASRALRAPIARLKRGYARLRGLWTGATALQPGGGSHARIIQRAAASTAPRCKSASIKSFEPPPKRTR